MSAYFIKSIKQGYSANIRDVILVIDGQRNQEEYSLTDYGYSKEDNAFLILAVNKESKTGIFTLSPVPLVLLKEGAKLEWDEPGMFKLFFPKLADIKDFGKIYEDSEQE